MRAIALGTFTLLAAAASLSAHGGQYRGPTTSAGARDNVPVVGTWQGWWETRREPLMRERTAPTGPITGSDDLHLGVRRGEGAPSPLVVTDVDRRDRIVPALLAMLADSSSRDVQTACLIALAKLGLDAPKASLEDVLVPWLANDDMEVRETAALALGIGGRPTAAPLLLALLRDDAEGRKLVAAGSVPDRTRTFAVYALALVARRNGTTAMQQQAADAFWTLIKTPATGTRDLRVAAVLGLGALRDPARPEGKRLAWQTVEDLLAWLGRDLGAGEEFVQAQAPLAIARLLGRGDSPVHQRCKRVFVAMLTADSPRGNALLQSAAIALGVLSNPAETAADDAPVSAALRAAYARGAEPHVRLFAVEALARIGGDANRAWLMREYARGNKPMEKPWLAIALGMFAHERAVAGAVDDDIARLLFDELSAAGNEDLRAPLALGFGLTRDRSRGPQLEALLAARAENERSAGYLCTAVGLVGNPAAIPRLRELMETSVRRPFVMQAAAIALGQLGDGEVTARLVKKLTETESAASLVALAAAIGRIGDRRAVEPLLDVLGKKDVPALARAFAIAALGWIADKDPQPWNLPFAEDANFAVEVDTLSNGSTGILDIL